MAEVFVGEKAAEWALSKIVRYFYERLKGYFDPRIFYKIKKIPVYHYESYLDFWRDLLGPIWPYEKRKNDLKTGDVVSLAATLNEWVPIAPALVDLLGDEGLIKLIKFAKKISKEKPTDWRLILQDYYAKMGVATVRLLPYSNLRLLCAANCRPGKDYGFAHLGVPVIMPDNVFREKLLTALRREGAVHATLIGKIVDIPAELVDQVEKMLPSYLRNCSPVRQAIFVDDKSRIRDIGSPDCIEAYAWTIATKGEKEYMVGDYFDVDPRENSYGINQTLNKIMKIIDDKRLKPITDFDAIKPRFATARLRPLINLNK